MESGPLKTVIIDNGSHICKIGYGSEDAPYISFPLVIGRPSPFRINIGNAEKNEIYMPDTILWRRPICKISYPIEKGIVTDWEAMEKVWKYCYFEQLRIHPEDHPVLLTEAPLNPKVNQEKMIQIFFETFNVPSLNISIAPILSLMASGRSTGIVLDVGHTVSSAVPIYEGYLLPKSVGTVEFGGRDLDAYFMKLLNEIGLKLSTKRDTIIVNEIKETVCYVASDYKEEVKNFSESEANNMNYTLPDGQVITVGSHRVRCPETLFEPINCDKKLKGVHELALKSIMDSDLDVRKDLYENIVLAGGSTMLNGFAERVEKEMIALAPKDARLRVIVPKRRKFSAWLGGSILSSLSSFGSMWVTKAEYEENGPQIVHRKF